MLYKYSKCYHLGILLSSITFNNYYVVSLSVVSFLTLFYVKCVTVTIMPLCFVSLSRTPVIHCVRTHRTNTWWDEHLTEDNASFVKKIITDEYQQLTTDKLNPLKDEPWPRHEWEEGGLQCPQVWSMWVSFPLRSKRRQLACAQFSVARLEMSKQITTIDK